MQLLVSALNANIDELILKMNIDSDAIIVNQCEENSYRDIQVGAHEVKVYSFAERGVGLSRNNALLRASAEICLFSDDDIEYVKNYEKIVEAEFENYPKADIILFQFDICPERKTYDNVGFKRVRWYNCGRYPTFCMAFRTASVKKSNVTFSLLFGGGAKYSNGEDSLFLQECIKKGLRVYATQTCLGREEPRESTWFKGYNEKFFVDRGVLYAFLYGSFARIFALRFIIKISKEYRNEMKMSLAYKYISKGIKLAKKI